MKTICILNQCMEEQMSNNGMTNSNNTSNNDLSNYSQRGSNVPQQPSVPPMPTPTKQPSNKGN